MNEELIKMCGCPEIWDRWEPKVGDRVISRYHKKEADIIFRIENDLGQGVNEWSTEYYTIFLLNNRSVGECKEDLIYIPRIEDLIEMIQIKKLKLSPLGLLDVLHKEFNNYHETGRFPFGQKNVDDYRMVIDGWNAKKYYKQFNDFTTLLLAFYMKFKHNKLWNANKKQWKKE